MKAIYCLLMYCILSSSSYGQTKPEVSTHYLFPEFIPGAIHMNHGIKHEVLLNYNRLTEEMIFESNGEKMAVGKNVIEIIDTIFIRDRKFVTLNGKIVELVKLSNWELYIEHKCKVKETGKPIGYGSSSKTTAISTLSSITLSGDSYQLKLPDIYEIEPTVQYWLKKYGELNRFTSMRELRKLFKDKKDLVNSYVKEHQLTYHNVDGIIQLIEFLESKEL